MDIRQLNYFLAVADTKNYSHAAKSLFVTQPTLSQSIKKLEMELNTTLFNQNGRQLILTEAGDILYSRGSQLVSDFNQIVSEIQKINHEDKEVIRLGLTSLFAIQFMTQISAFIATHANVEVTLIQEGSRKLQDLLSEGKIDIGLLSFPIINPNIKIEPLNTSTNGYQVSVVAPSDHPLSSKESIHLANLKGTKIASLTEHYMLGEMLPRRCRALGFEPNIVFKHSDWEILLHSLTNLGAVTLLPKEFQTLSKVDGLTWIDLQDKNDFYPIGIAYRHDTIFTPVVEDLLQLIKTN
ncbi:hypothetical protein HMPREF9318_00403 [Streptococcus urinalis FB127-CNA-2]|uniref:LysR substrate binding domain protein n=1 Tax=Streptococcus urinalis 2285-97 TaxID=764291 RepID=G5KFZ5_9STRE|nr:LysR substrate-binding domain-containing protein [Streptococcus urinalis]EHJ57357.1 LysR substrate binding domain protein [Streptococcus urinalis 2285-97]EKS22205.1 hypothetical protein HMPREF9318_00403 [Streptococcus urinalis FB127-CNA-2]VEF32017.1 transcriptional regulator, LysR family [Streptococcus urinalis]